MRVFILAIDGLEYTLVRRWRLSNLQQEVCGWIDASEFKNLLTPIIWASFITGQHPDVHGIKSWWGVSSSSQLNSLLHWALYNLPVVKGMSWNKLRKMLKFVGMEVRPPQHSDLRKKGLQTIFDYSSKPVVIDVPSYNESADTRARFSRAMDLGLTSYEKEIWNIHQERMQKIMNNLDNEWDLFMSWLDLADQMGHLWMGKNKIKMLKVYTHLDSLAWRIKQKLPNDTLCMIVSDHGMITSDDKIPIHGKRAFYSFNMDIDWTPNSIMDYADYIKNQLELNVSGG
jgi:predicted AlkP superfamily phosphohydrolase/phosphomutase